MTTKTTKNANPAGSSLLDPSRETVHTDRKTQQSYEYQILLLIEESWELSSLHSNICPDCHSSMNGSIPGTLICTNCYRMDVFE